eukprot:1410792-Prymnesium_polylepis.1
MRVESVASKFKILHRVWSGWQAPSTKVKAWHNVNPCTVCMRPSPQDRTPEATAVQRSIFKV